LIARSRGAQLASIRRTAMSQPRPLTLPPDGRQSAVAAGLQRGVRRHFAALGAASLPEFSLANGRRADVIALFPDGRITIVEIKSCLADWRADRKWPAYRDFCDDFSFAVPETFPLDRLPEEVGVLMADAFGAAVLRLGPSHPLAAARRKAVTLRFAHAAAGLLHALADPGAIADGRR
jgi:hypothetical protein